MTTAAAVTAGPGEPLAGPGVATSQPSARAAQTQEPSARAAQTQQPADARARQVHSFDVAAFPVPTGREEEWRFTPLARLRGLHALDPADAGTGNGKVVVDVDPAPEVRVETVGRGDPRVGSSYVPFDRPSALAFAARRSATVLTVPAEAVTSRPTYVTVRGEGPVADPDGPAFGHLRVDVRELASAVVVIDFTGSATLADTLEVTVGDGARLTLVSVHDWASDAVHLARHALRVGRDATVTSVVVTLGGDLVRVTPTVEYTGPGGDATLLGLFFADSGQHLEHRLFVDHAVPRCRSRVAYKGALQGSGAHTVWVGDVLVRKAAEGTDTYELNRNLVLTDGARADSVPNLELETGEVVGAGHASATGRFDDEQLFYLQSRGIPADIATRLVVQGFFTEVVDAIGVPELEQRLRAAVDRELAKSLGTLPA